MSRNPFLRDASVLESEEVVARYSNIVPLVQTKLPQELYVECWSTSTVQLTGILLPHCSVQSVVNITNHFVCGLLNLRDLTVDAYERNSQ